MARIIIVEDDPMIAEIYQKKFTEAGFEALVANSGEQVLTLAKKEQVEAILLDLILPKMDGFEVLKVLRDGDYDRNIKIIISSNLNQKEDQDKAIKLGANGFITKSEYTPSNLIKEVERLLNQFGEEKKNEIREENIQSGQIEKNSIKKKILMIEDEEIFLEMFGDKLRQDGYEVKLASNGAWGLKEALQGDYDLFVIDMIMPHITGDEIVAKLKLEDKTKNKPIIILSASVDELVQKKVESMGISAFFVKTQLVPSDLSRKVGEILG